MTSLGVAFVDLLLWGAIATALLSGILFGAQSIGISRLSLPLLLGTCFTAERGAATVLGLVLYTLGGWLFALIYLLIFASIQQANWLLGSLIGAVQGLILLVVLMPLLPYLHPRMTSPHDGPNATSRLHPPGFLALHYGYATPIVTLIAHACFGAVLGATLPWQ